MELNVKNRLILLRSLPQEGNITTLKIVRDLQNSLSFSEEEHKRLNFRSESGVARWDNDFTKDINIGEKATDVIKESLQKLDREKKLHSDHLELWEMFME